MPIVMVNDQQIEVDVVSTRVERFEMDDMTFEVEHGYILKTRVPVSRILSGPAKQEHWHGIVGRPVSDYLD